MESAAHVPGARLVSRMASGRETPQVARGQPGSGTGCHVQVLVAVADSGVSLGQNEKECQSNFNDGISRKKRLSCDRLYLVYAGLNSITSNVC